jgi:hypothetical protein
MIPKGGSNAARPLIYKLLPLAQPQPAQVIIFKVFKRWLKGASANKPVSSAEFRKLVIERADEAMAVLDEITAPVMAAAE